ncbi:translation initiation factor IF-3 [Haemophilus pittmaniae HK 85]|uniref:Translation initiation factor IF-3 n=1 Tax=Haemophilus pittmaniae HK 85 TaxID=1035188 RepID=F9QBL1_9PAST|nr:translation initiation factor IF-3 [Haemophilus pittmaniae HK 85]
MRFRGREMAHQDIGLDVLERVKQDTEELAVVESAPGKLEGRQAIMVIAPKKNNKQ